MGGVIYILKNSVYLQCSRNAIENIINTHNQGRKMRKSVSALFLCSVGERGLKKGSASGRSLIIVIDVFTLRFR